MKKQKILENLLKEALAPLLLEVIDESPNHNVPEGSESHFSALIVSDKFSGLSLLKRHQLVHSIIEEQIQGGIHAFSQQTLTPEEFQERGGELPVPPPCIKKV